ncbi:uncharacterized protein EKO05_0005744 [Ascochyta rabiei]|uniref:uncharacterized protein n=1 Tax=Didymella rabiei TaxID=5454 RepID=UPI0019012D0D|nr:uncharacterized protein EKO05_0005744 [Ascochyta rabiei]UPX15290.1 hypothetical protein EKO05_0005744 [Ascochyta rabiei]
MLGNRLVIGLDYGTTYTGVSFCETSDAGALEKHIEVIKDWPSRHTKIGTKEKVPSEIAYLSDGMKWGSLIPTNAQRHMWTKLELDSPQAGEAARIQRELVANTRVTLKQPVDIVADFLEQVKGHLIKNLDTQYGEELWRTLPITLVITVPAVWSDAAKARTHQAVRMAGFDNSSFPKLKRTITITEPEAAATYTIQSLRGSAQDEQFALGDGFIVCDMGGGTVDLISYIVAELNPTILEEATVGDGDQCGGSFVERGFLKWLERRLGTADFVKVAGCRSDEIPRTSMSKKLGQMVQDFVLEAKSGFCGTETSYLRLPTPLSAVDDDESRGISDGEIVITSEDMQEMFEFPLRRTYELILGQIQQARCSGKVQLKHLIMVGGFSESPYMYEKIKAFAKLNGLQAIRPANAWSAVVRGAAAKGLEGDGRKHIKNRKCRRNYGTECSRPFDAKQHKEIDAYICPFSGQKKARDQMAWGLKKGQDLSTSEVSHASTTFGQHIWVGNKRHSSIELMASDADKPATRASDKTVYTLATLDVDLSMVPEREFQLMYSPSGVACHKLEFDMEISVESTIEYSLTVNGIKYGSVNAKYH